MIIIVAGWFYIVSAVLALLSLAVDPSGFKSTAITLVYAALFGPMGFGLLKRASWGRTMAIGCSLLGWTLGALILIVMTGYFLFVVNPAFILGILFSASWFAALAWLVVFSLVISAVGVIISFKLFWHLCSAEGCEEFGVPPGNTTPTVVASTGAWLGLMFVNITSTGDGQFMYQIVASALSRDSKVEARRAEVGELDRRQVLREREARRAAAKAKTEAEIQARLEAAHVEEAEPAAQPGVIDTPPPAEQPVVSEAAQAPEVAAASVTTPQDEEDSAPSSRKIIKCREASGGITFTQGYCPPGSKQVEMTPAQ